MVEGIGPGAESNGYRPQGFGVQGRGFRVDDDDDDDDVDENTRAWDCGAVVRGM